MSDSYRDGVKGGGHRDCMNTEIWSRRCPRVNMWGKQQGRAHRRKRNTNYKVITHRYERRMARAEILRRLDEAA